jgi:hypothetical protein
VKGAPNHDACVTSPRVLIAAGSIAATLAGIVPVLNHGGQAEAAPLQASAAGISISAADATSAVVVPAGTKVLRGTAFGSRAYGKQVRLTIVRAADGATLFTGSLATFHALPVVAGTKLVVRVQRPAGDAGPRAGATLSWP